MAKRYRMYVGTWLIQFQIGVNVIGIPDIHTHVMIISKSISEVDAKKYNLL
jgi:hypothetical protein